MKETHTHTHQTQRHPTPLPSAPSFVSSAQQIKQSKAKQINPSFTMVNPCGSFNNLLAISDSACRGISSLAGTGGAPSVAHATKVDVGARGLRSLNCTTTFGLCTETLGSESSSDEISVVGDREEAVWTAGEDEDKAVSVSLSGVAMRRERDGTGGGKTFPPPLPSLMNAGATRHAFMKAERRDGRLILTPVTVERPQIFRACRYDGRLQLQLIQSHEDTETEEEVHAELEQEEEEEVQEDYNDEDEETGVEFDGERGKEEANATAAFEPWRWLNVNAEGCYNRRCNDVSTAAAGGAGPSSSPFPLFWNNPRFMTTA